MSDLLKPSAFKVIRVRYSAEQTVTWGSQPKHLTADLPTGLSARLRQGYSSDGETEAQRDTQECRTGPRPEVAFQISD